MTLSTQYNDGLKFNRAKLLGLVFGWNLGDPGHNIAADNVTDDSAAIQAVIDGAADGDTIVVPPGRYRLESALSWTGKQLTILAMPGAVFVEGVALTVPMLTASSANGSLIEGLTFEGIETQGGFSGLESDRVGLELFATTEALVRSVTVLNKSYAIRLDQCIRSTVRDVVVTGFLTSSVAGANFCSGVDIQGGLDNLVSGGTIRQVGSGVLGRSDTQRARVFGIHAQTFFDNGVYISSGYACQVQHCTFRDGASLGSISGVKVRGSKHVVSNNEIEDVGAGVHISGNGVVADAFGCNGHGIIVANNVIEDTVNDGILSSFQDDFPLRHSRIAGNILTNTATAGGGFAAIRASLLHSDVDDNIIEGTDGTTAAIVASWASPPVGAGAPSRGIMNIRRNTITDSASDVIRIQALDQSDISDNVGHNITSQDVIDARDVDDSAIRNNACYDGTATVSVRTDASCADCTIWDNWADNPATTRNALIAGTNHRLRMWSKQTPEALQAAGPGSVYHRIETGGGAGTLLYVKESGTGNTGWVAK